MTGQAKRYPVFAAQVTTPVRQTDSQMDRKALLVVAVLVAVSVSGCSSVLQKYNAMRAYSKDMKPGHHYRTFYMPSGSMEPTILPLADMLVDTSAYESGKPQRGDIIVFKPPISSKNPFVKRVLAIPGDRLAFHAGHIELNGHALPASYPPMHPNYELRISSYSLIVDREVLNADIADLIPRSRWTAPDRLPPGCYFVIGDNITNSEDSHIFGCVEIRGTFSSGELRGRPTELVGKVVSIVQPLPKP
jgi:signal peptidase I